MKRFVAAFALLSVTVISCGGTAAPTAAPPSAVPPSATVVPAATAAPTAVPPTAAPPTAAPATPPLPTPLPTASATSPPATLLPTSHPPSGAASPAPMDLLISYADESLRGTCAAHDQVYATELATVSCGTEDLPFTYSLFGSTADMAAAYNHDLALGESPPQQGGKCIEANYEAPYSMGDTPTGRVNCRQHHSSTTGDLYRVIEWTNDHLLVIGYFSNREDLHTWDELIKFWQEHAGPFAS